MSMTSIEFGGTAGAFESQLTALGSDKRSLERALREHHEPVEVKTIAIDNAAVLEAVRRIRETALCQLFERLVKASKGQSVCINEGGDPELWEILVCAGTVNRERSMTVVGNGKIADSAPRSVRLPNDKLGWSKQSIAELLELMKADEIIGPLIQAARERKMKKLNSQHD